MPRKTEFGYARASDGAYIGFRIDGDGPIDIVYQPDFPGNIDLEWDDAVTSPWLPELAAMGRVISHDHRGVGLSSRDMGLPNLETRVSDLMAVLEKTEADHPIMTGVFSTGAVNVLAAATRPGLARAIVWALPVARFAWAPDYPWGNSWEALDAELAELPRWGTEGYARWLLDAEASTGNPQPFADVDALARQTRNACTPDVARELSRIWYETDVRGVLSSVQTPTLLLVPEGRTDAVEQARYIANLMPAAEVREMPRKKGAPEEQLSWLDEIRRFIGAERPPIAFDTVLTTVVFTDIVDSTALQARLGDREWKHLIERHHARVRDGLARYGGQEQDTAGDGFFARFDGPARAIRATQDIATAVRDLGIEIRAGVHTGECEIADGKCTGLSVSIGARVMSNAGPSEVLVSQTVKDLVAGSGFAFEDAGEHELKGVPDTWHLYRVIA